MCSSASRCVRRSIRSNVFAHKSINGNGHPLWVIMTARLNRTPRQQPGSRSLMLASVFAVSMELFKLSRVRYLTDFRPKLIAEQTQTPNNGPNDSASHSWIESTDNADVLRCTGQIEKRQLEPRASNGVRQRPHARRTFDSIEICFYGISYFLPLSSF